MNKLTLTFFCILFLIHCRDTYSQESLGTANGVSTYLNESNENFIDARDGSVYPIVQIDSILWFAKNLSYKPEEGKFWVFRKDERTIDNLGYLYNWETALNVCPTGWELPSKEDFSYLIEALDERYGVEYYSLLPGGRSGLDFGTTGVKYGGNFVFIEGVSVYWSSTENNKRTVWGLSVYGKEQQVKVYNTFKKKSGIPVRCIKRLE